jgi:hypothetical protein
MTRLEVLITKEKVKITKGFREAYTVYDPIKFNDDPKRFGNLVATVDYLVEKFPLSMYHLLPHLDYEEVIKFWDIYRTRVGLECSKT